MGEFDDEEPPEGYKKQTKGKKIFHIPFGHDHKKYMCAWPMRDEYSKETMLSKAITARCAPTHPHLHTSPCTAVLTPPSSTPFQPPPAHPLPRRAHMTGAGSSSGGGAGTGSSGPGGGPGFTAASELGEAAAGLAKSSEVMAKSQEATHLAEVAAKERAQLTAIESKERVALAKIEAKARAAEMEVAAKEAKKKEKKKRKKKRKEKERMRALGQTVDSSSSDSSSS